MSNKPLTLTTPVGRLVGGSLYEPRTTDYDGKPLVVKSGPNAGQARKEFSFGIAIPKTPGVQHWANEAWGAQVWALANTAFPNGETQRPDFAWKITDGDSAIPNKKGVKPCDREGFRGHWVIWFSGGTPPRVYNADGSQLIVEEDAVKPGYYIQVFGNVKDNKPSQSPGLYWNHSMVAFAAYGEEIVFGPDVSAAGFGKGVQLPPGATSAPTFAGMPVTGAVAAPPAPAASVPAHLPVGSVPAPAVPAPTVVAPPPSPVTPNPDMRAVPGAAPVAPPPPPVNAGPAGYRMANPAMAYDDMIKSGWTDALLIQHGHLVPA